MIPSTRTRRSPVDRFDVRRNELAESALLTLGELGYARTSLRDIAGNSQFSHGVLHYYFEDKIELVAYSITYYKMRCIHRYDEVVERSTTGQELLDGFAAKLVETLSTRRRCTASGTTCASRACSTTGSARRCC